MEVVLLGTGSARGWPEPGCSCGSCSTAAARRTSRGPATALVDDILLLDGFDGVERAAAQAGRTLADVRQVLLSDNGADVAAGVPMRVGEHVLRAIRQGSGLAWDVTGSDGARLLYAPGAAPLQEEPLHAVYDVVVLGVGSAGDTLARLRADGAVQGSTQIVAVGYGHDDELPDAVEARLQSWGVRLPDDGTTLVVHPSEHPADVPADPVRGRILVLGGVRSGKSVLAEQLLSASPGVTYVATGGTRDGDAEWQERVAAHVARRPATWTTVETQDVAACLREAQGPLLVDCLGTWLTGRLDQHGVWDGAAVTPVHADVDELVSAWRAATSPVVAVSNEVGSGVVPASASGRLFRDLLGRLNARIAAESETVLLTVAGIAVPLRAPRRT